MPIFDKLLSENNLSTVKLSDGKFSKYISDYYKFMDNIIAKDILENIMTKNLLDTDLLKISGTTTK